MEVSLSIDSKATSALGTDSLVISWLGSAEDDKMIAKDASDTVVTIPACSPVDALPTTSISPASALPAVPQKSTGPLNAGNQCGPKQYGLALWSFSF